MDPSTKPASPLLALPIELQLTIYELALISPTPLLLNCACNSSYRHNHTQLREDHLAWREGTKHAPHEPALTKTSRHIRHLTVPIFYSQNEFRMHYCSGAHVLIGFNWLEDIGEAKRRMLGRLFLYDRNVEYDGMSPHYIREVKRKLGERYNVCFEPVMGRLGVYWHVSFGGVQGLDYEGVRKLWERGEIGLCGGDEDEDVCEGPC